MNFRQFLDERHAVSKDESTSVELAKHDARFHPHGIGRHTRCKFREDLRKAEMEDMLSTSEGKVGKEDEANGFDRVSRMVSVLRRWLPGCKVEEVSQEDAIRHLEENGPVESWIRYDVGTPKKKRFSVKGDRTDIAIATRNDPLLWTRGYRVIAKGVPDVVADCIGRHFNVDPDEVASSETRMFKQFFHCMEPSSLSERGYFNSLNGHDVTEKEACAVLKAIARPIMVLRPKDDKANKDAVRVICEIPGAVDDRSVMVVPVRFTREKNGVFVAPLTMFPLDTNYITSIKHEDVLFIDEKRTQGLRAQPSFTPIKHGRPGRLVHGFCPLTEKDFVEEDRDIVSQRHSSRNQALAVLSNKHKELLSKGDVPGARKVYWEYAEAKGWEHKYDKSIGATVLVNAEGRKKSDDIEYDGEGGFLDLEDRLNVNLPRGDEREWREHKKTKAARQYDYYFRHFFSDDGRVAGWYDRRTGNVAIVKGVATAETVAHELGWHATFHWAEKHHPKLHSKLMEYARTAPEGIVESVKEKYGCVLDDRVLLDEIGAERFTRDDISPLLDSIEMMDSEEWMDGLEGVQDEARVEFADSIARRTHAGWSHGGSEFSRSELDRIASLPPREAVRELVLAMLSGRALATDSAPPQGFVSWKVSQRRLTQRHGS